MTIRLIKQGQETKAKDKPAEQPSTTQILLATQAWVEEFKANKSSKNNSALINFSNLR
jgi:hypothetical protein